MHETTFSSFILFASKSPSKGKQQMKLTSTKEFTCITHQDLGVLNLLSPKLGLMDTAWASQELLHCFLLVLTTSSVARTCLSSSTLGQSVGDCTTRTQTAQQTFPPKGIKAFMPYICFSFRPPSR